MLPHHFWIRNVNLWNADKITKNADVLVEGGIIQKIIPSNGEMFETDFDGQSQTLLPIGIDLQVHLRVPGQSEKETPLTGLKAALRGGIGAVLTMPNTKPVIDNPEVVALTQKLVAEASRQTGVRVLISAAMTLNQDGRVAVRADDLKKAGVVALTDDGKGVASDEAMEKVFQASAESGLPVLQHAEVPGHGAHLAPGSTQKKLGLREYPASAEWKMVERDLNLLKKYPRARYHVLHVSSAKTLELVDAAKKAGLHATCEVTPHHLFFNSDEIPSGDTNYKMNPPIRSEADREALVKGLASGSVDFVSTDHAPHEKEKKGDNFEASAFGTTGLETSLRVLLTLYQQKKLSPERLVQVFSSVPASYIGIEKEFGSLEVGKAFKAVWVDVEAKPSAVQVSELESLSKNNCFIGQALGGKILGVFNEAGTFRF